MSQLRRHETSPYFIHVISISEINPKSRRIGAPSDFFEDATDATTKKRAEKVETVCREPRTGTGTVTQVPITRNSERKICHISFDNFFESSVLLSPDPRTLTFNAIIVLKLLTE